MVFFLSPSPDPTPSPTLVEWLREGGGWCWTEEREKIYKLLFIQYLTLSADTEQDLHFHRDKGLLGDLKGRPIYNPQYSTDAQAPCYYTTYTFLT